MDSNGPIRYWRGPGKAHVDQDSGAEEGGIHKEQT